MSNDTETKLCMVFDRENSTLSFSVLRGSKSIVIPRSLVRYRKFILATQMTPRMVEFTLPHWKVKEQRLDEFIVD